MASEQNIGMAIKTLSNQFHRYMTASKLQMRAEIPELQRITDIQGRIINYLHSQPEDREIYQQEIEKLFNIRQSTTTNILKRIERNGLIYRKKSTRDARMNTVALTDRAKILCPLASEGIQRAEKQVATGLSDAEIALFFRIVGVMLKNIA